MTPERGLIGDLTWALAVMAGVVLAALVFGVDPSLLAGAAIGVTLVVTVRVISRHRRRASGR